MRFYSARAASARERSPKSLSNSAILEPMNAGCETKTAKRLKVIRPPSISVVFLIQQLRALIEYFDLLLTLTHHRIRVRYKQSVLGLGWALAQPVALMAIYTMIFSVVTRMPSEGVPYAAFVYAGLLPWTFFATGVGSAAGSLVSHAQLITKVYFPREIVPLTYVLAGMFDFVIASLVLGALMVWYSLPVGLSMLWVIPVLLIATSFVSALALFLSAVQVRFRDVGFAIPLLMQIWMFASPVVYPLSAVPERFRAFYILNPMAGVVENFRRVVLQRTQPDLESLWTAAIVSSLALPVSYLLFKHTEATMADII
jgi:lipopolysaccharide transport system permease protein